MAACITISQNLSLLKGSVIEIQNILVSIPSSPNFGLQIMETLSQISEKVFDRKSILIKKLYSKDLLF